MDAVASEVGPKSERIVAVAIFLAPDYRDRRQGIDSSYSLFPGGFPA